jgi:hypothetical protein
MQRIKTRILEWLAPGLGAEVTRQRWLIEAMHDLHMTQLPYGEAELEMAFQNCRAMEEALVKGEATVQGRQASLIEIYRRSR